MMILFEYFVLNKNLTVLKFLSVKITQFIGN